MKAWWTTFGENLWLRPDDVGAEEAAFIKRALRLRREQQVLDAPCGAGRVAIHLARTGCVVTGIDLQATFIRRAKKRFRAENLPGRFLTQDMRTLDIVDTFHAIYNWQGSFGYFSEVDNVDLLRCYVRALRPGGRLLIDQPNRQRLLRQFKPVIKLDHRTLKNRWSKAKQRIHSDWIEHTPDGNRHNRMSIRLYTLSQLRTLFTRAGLIVEAAYGSSNNEPYSRTSKRLILVGRKASLALPNTR